MCNTNTRPATCSSLSVVRRIILSDLIAVSLKPACKPVTQDSYDKFLEYIQQNQPVLEPFVEVSPSVHHNVLGLVLLLIAWHLEV